MKIHEYARDRSDERPNRYLRSMEIYLVRHGQTDYNLKGIVQGRGVNSGLNATGLRQAEALHRTYGHLTFDRIYVSALKRTHQTVRLFLADGIEPLIRPELDEIDWGIYEGVAHDPQMHERYLSIIQRWREGELDIRIDGGESARNLHRRQRPFINELKQLDAARILVCSHGRSIRMLLCAMTGKPMAEMDDFPHANTCLYKLYLRDGRFDIERFNDTSHLDEADPH